MREELIADGELVPVEVEGVRGKRFVLKEEVALLEAPPEPPPSVAFLPPFDPLVWDRGLLGSLFEFDYVWELFFPPAKRRWGWYVLPMLFRDRLVGRIEPRIDRAAGQVQVLGLWWEDGFAPRRTEGFVDAMRDALRAYLRFGGATRLEWAPHLARRDDCFSRAPRAPTGGSLSARLCGSVPERGLLFTDEDFQPQQRRVGRDEGPRGLARQGRARRPTHRR